MYSTFLFIYFCSTWLYFLSAVTIYILKTSSRRRAGSLLHSLHCVIPAKMSTMHQSGQLCIRASDEQHWRSTGDCSGSTAVLHEAQPASSRHNVCGVYQAEAEGGVQASSECREWLIYPSKVGQWNIRSRAEGFQSYSGFWRVVLRPRVARHASTLSNFNQQSDYHDYNDYFCCTLNLFKFSDLKQSCVYHSNIHAALT